MNINDPVYLVISCRKTTDTDVETDFIINDQHYLIQAIERVNLDGMIDAEPKLRSKFPKNLILSTHTPLLNMLDIYTRKMDLESQIAADGGLVHVKKSTGRIAKAFEWESKHNPIYQSGLC